MNYISTAKLRMYCNDTGLHGQELAAASGVSIRLIKVMFALPFQHYSDRTLERLANALNIMPSALTAERMEMLDYMHQAEKKAAAAEAEGLAETAALYQAEAEKVRKVL